MSTKAELEEKAEGCDTSEEYVGVAREIVQDLSDKAWAAELLDEGAEWAQTTDELILFAKCAAEALEDSEKTKQYLLQAKDFAMTIDELVKLAGTAAEVGDSDAATEVLSTAQGKCTKIADFFSLSKNIKTLLSDEELADGLRDSGLLTRDSRLKERKKYGLRGARRGTQFSKR